MTETLPVSREFPGTPVGTRVCRGGGLWGGGVPQGGYTLTASQYLRTLESLVCTPPLGTPPLRAPTGTPRGYSSVPAGTSG